MNATTHLNLGTGVHRVAAADYHADRLLGEPTLSSTAARTLLERSPLHAWTASPSLNPNHEPVTKKTFDIGHAAHRAVLGAGADWAVYPPGMLAKNGSTGTNAARDWAEGIRDRGMTPIKAEDEDAVLDMAEAVNEALAAAGIAFPPARSELTALAEIEGAWCRAMIDHVPEDPRAPIYDLKSTIDAHPNAVQRTVMRYGYHIQAAHYLDTWQAATGEEREFRFVFVEKTPPFAVTVAQLHPDVIELGRRQARRARMEWARCLREGQWPSYPLAIVTVELPEWFADRGLASEIEMEDWRAAAGGRASRTAIATAYRAQQPHGVPA
jgi:hypothetical protein